VHEYGKDKRLKSFKTYSDTNQLISTAAYNYRQDGLLEEINQYTADKRTILNLHYTYDAAGKRQEIIRTPGNGVALKAVAIYQADGKLSKIQYWQKDILLFLAEITYEKNSPYYPDFWEIYDSLNFEIEM
jgi:hypothetical protein